MKLKEELDNSKIMEDINTSYWIMYKTTWQRTNKGIDDLNRRPETLKLLEENIGGKLLDISCDNDFLDLTLTRKAKKQK